MKYDVSLLLVLLQVLFVGVMSFKHPKDYLDVCGWGWQDEYIALHRSIMQGKTKGKYIIAIPVKAGLADMIHGYVSAFIWALITNRALLITRNPVLDDEDQTQRTIEFGYHSPFINWTAPPISTKAYACLLPPYGGHNKVCDDRVPVLSSSPGQLSRKIIGGVNGGFTSEFLTDDLTKKHSDKDVFFTVSNRGATLKILENPFHKQLMMTKYNLTRHTAFPCLFHFLFKLNHDACLGPCKETAKKLHRSAKDPKSVSIAIHVRNPDTGPEEYFHCADSLISHYKSLNFKIVIVVVTYGANWQKAAKEKYGDMLLLPTGVPENIEGVHDRSKKRSREEEEELDRKATLDSARDYYILSLADIQILTRRSGFGAVGAMSKLTTKHVMYHLELEGKMKECAANLDGDDLSIWGNEWSEL